MFFFTSSKSAFPFCNNYDTLNADREGYKSFPASDPRDVAMFLETRSLRSMLDMLLNVVFGITHRGQCRWTSILGNERGILAVRIRCTLSDRWMPRVFELHRRLDTTTRLGACTRPDFRSDRMQLQYFVSWMFTVYDAIEWRLVDGADGAEFRPKNNFSVILNINRYQCSKNFSPTFKLPSIKQIVQVDRFNFSFQKGRIFLIIISAE